MTAEMARSAIGFKLQTLVQSICSIKTTDPIIQAYPGIHHNRANMIACRDWLINEYGTPAPSKWDKVADAVFYDLPIIEAALIDALKANGLQNP